MKLEELRRKCFRHLNMYPGTVSTSEAVTAYVISLEQEISDKDEKIRIVESILKSYEKKVKL